MGGLPPHNSAASSVHGTSFCKSLRYRDGLHQGTASDLWLEVAMGKFAVHKKAGTTVGYFSTSGGAQKIGMCGYTRKVWKEGVRPARTSDKTGWRFGCLWL